MLGNDNLKLYKADFANDEIEIIYAENDNDALIEAWELEKENGDLFNLYLIDNDYDIIKTIL